MKKIILLVFITFISLIGINSIKAQTNLKVSIYDDTGKYVEFTNTNEAKLGMKNGKANPYKVRIEVEFDDASSGKQIEVNLKEGINLVDNGSKTLTNFLKGSVTHTGQTKKVLGTTYNANNGKITYNFTDLTIKITYEIIIAPDVKLDIEQIQNAISVKQIQNSEVKNTKSINTNASLNEVPITVNGNNQSFNVALDEEVVKTNTMRLAGFNIWKPGIYVGKIFKIVNIYIEVPLDVEHKSFTRIYNNVNGTSIIGWKTDKPKQITNKDGKTVNQYKFSIYNIINSDYASIGISPTWIFPSSKFKNGDKIDIVATKIEYQTYGKDMISKDISYKQTYTISNTENVIAYSNKYQIYVAKPKRLDDIIPLGYINFQNTGGVKSKEKELVYNFDDDGYGITDVVFAANKDLKTTDVWYQTKTCNTPTNCVYDTTWKTKNINLNLSEIYKRYQSHMNQTQFYPYELNKDDLKLGNNTYITKLKINIDSINPNDEAIISSLIFKFFGKRLVSKNEYKTTFEVNDVGYNNTNIGATTGKKESIVTIDGKYYFANHINSRFNVNQIINSGDTINSIYTSELTDIEQIYRNEYSINPVYYIRSETGLPITNLKLIGNDDKTNIIDQCIISDPYKASDGALIYKIDTKNVKNNLAAIGIYVNVLKNFKLTFDIQTPIDFSDNGKLHDFSTALFITDPNAEFSYLSGDNNGTLNGDPFDVNKNGKTDDVMHYDKQRNIFYQIKNSNDLNVYSYIKKDSEKDEQYKYSLDDKDSIIIKKGEKINLKTSLYNSSGVTVKESEVYIPIPKINDNWGELMYNNKAFEYDLELSDKISNPDSSKNKIYYCIVKSTKNLNDLKNMDCKEEISQNELSKVNMIKLKTISIEDKEKQDIVFNLKSTKDVSSKTNIYRPIYFRNLTNKDGEVKTGWVYSKYLSIQTQKINPTKVINPKTGKVIYIIPVILLLISTVIMYYVSSKRVKNI